MKIRNGFVSNSSSSSFCILGFSIDSDLAKKLDNSLTGETPLCVAHAISSEGVQYVGMYPESLGEDETLNGFRERIVVEIKKYAPELEVEKSNLSWVTDGGYNG